MTRPSRRYPWPENAGPYRTIDDLVYPWIPSPMISSFLDVTLKPPLIPAGPQNPRSRRRCRTRDRRAFLSRLVRLFSGSSPRDAAAARFPARSASKIPSHTDSNDKPSNRRLLPSDWRAYSYWSAPTVNGVPVSNATPGQASTTNVNPHRVFRNLRGPTGSPHPENWVPGLRHPALPPRPALWKVPHLGDPLPFPWEVQLNPFLEHRYTGATPLFFDIGRAPSSILFGETANTIPLETGDRAQPATFPLLTHMHIVAVADDTAPRFPWPFMVHNRAGIRCQDVFDAVYENFQEHVTQQEFGAWSARRRERCSRAYFARNACRRSPDDGLRRVDYLCDRVMFRGLEPSPNKDGSWILYLGLD